MPEQQHKGSPEENPMVPPEQTYMNVLHNVMETMAEKDSSSLEVDGNMVTVDRDELIQGAARLAAQVTHDFQQGKFDDGAR